MLFYVSYVFTLTVLKNRNTWRLTLHFTSPNNYFGHVFSSSLFPTNMYYNGVQAILFSVFSFNIL